jgi:glycosyltransferase involved in cell wall biosynthesis
MNGKHTLLDVTRLISRSWTGRIQTGIDRVASAYLDYFGLRSLAVVQHRGVFRILNAQDSQRLFELLRGPDASFRRRLMAFAPIALRRAATSFDGDGAVYLNVSHTDFDLPQHVDWVGRCGLRAMYLIHDLIPVTHPEYCRPHAVRRHRERVRNALRFGAGIIVNSRATANELASFAQGARLPMPPVLASSLAGAKFDKPLPASFTENADYFLCLGTIEPRKNHALLLDVWESLARDTTRKVPDLVIVGQWGRNSEPVRRRIARSAVLKRHVRVLDRCPDSDLAGWIAGARALLMPTFAEGFGLPLVEALDLGTPVIASDVPCLAEIGKGIPTLLDPKRTDVWRSMIARFDAVHPERRRQLEQMHRFHAPRWSDHFSAVEAWLPGVAATQRRAEAVANISMLASVADCGYAAAKVAR